jgi:serine/threonine protein phosphatase 1
VKRHLAIGDIHGCFNALKSLVEFVSFRPDDTIVTLGDYVDRGPDSRAVLEFLIEFGKTHNHVALRGNHEIMMLDSRDNKSWFGPWMSYGGAETLRSYAAAGADEGTFDDVPPSHYEFLQDRLVSYYECETHFFVHANVDPAKPLENQADSSLYWRKYRGPVEHVSGKIMVCGHSAQRDGAPRVDKRSVCIDTWAHGGGWLTCLDVGSAAVWQANEKGATRAFQLGEVPEDIF